MDKNLAIQDLSIVLVARDHNPNMLLPDLLKGIGIIPSDWELARPPVVNESSAQVGFSNGITLVAQPGLVTFSQTIADDDLDRLMVAELAQKYVKSLPNLGYQALGINPRRFVTFGPQPEAAHNFITEKILCRDAEWLKMGDAPLQANINLAYSFNGVPLRLSINEVRLQMASGESMAAVLFAGNFHHQLVVENIGERISDLQKWLENWRVDWNIYRDIVETKFLSQAQMDWDLAIKDAVSIGLVEKRHS